MEHRQQSLVKWVLTRRMTVVDLEATDLDDDGVVSAAEFVIYRLKEMGKINREDVALVMEEFENLDVDQPVGSGSTLDLASRLLNIRVVVLHSPILSGLNKNELCCIIFFLFLC